MTWWQWIFFVLYAYDGASTYWKAVNNKIYFYKDCLDVINCATGTLCCVFFIDMLMAFKIESTNIKECLITLGVFIAFLLLLSSTYSKTRLKNHGLDPSDIWLIHVHKMLWAPIAFFGAIQSTSMIFDKNKSGSDRTKGLFLLSSIIFIFNPLVNGDRVDYLRGGNTSKKQLP